MYHCITNLVQSLLQQHASRPAVVSPLAQKILRGRPYIASPLPYPLPFCFPSRLSSSQRRAPAHIHRTPAQPVTLHKPQGLGLLASGGISLSIACTREAHVGWQGRRAAPVAPWGVDARDYPCCWHQWQMRRWWLWPLLKILFLCALLPTMLALTPAACPCTR